MKTGTDVVIVIPTYCELANLTVLIPQVHEALPLAKILIVDDASGDGTPEWVRDHELYESSLYLFERPGKLGFSSALIEGYHWALKQGAMIVGQMDADWSHNPEDLPRLLAAMDCADLVVGSRYCSGGGVKDWSKLRELLSRSAARYVRLWTGLPLHDPTAGFRMYRSSILAQLLKSKSKCDGYGFQVEMAHATWKAGAALIEVPVLFVERREGQSKLTFNIIIEAVFKIPLLRVRS